MDARRFGTYVVVLAVAASLPSLWILFGADAAAGAPAARARLLEVRTVLLVACGALLAVLVSARVRYVVHGGALARHVGAALAAVTAYAARAEDVRPGRPDPGVRPAFDEMKTALDALASEVRASRLPLDRWTASFASAVMLLGATPEALASPEPTQVEQGLEILKAVLPGLSSGLAELRDVLAS